MKKDNYFDRNPSAYPLFDYEKDFLLAVANKIENGQKSIRFDIVIDSDKKYERMLNEKTGTEITIGKYGLLLCCGDVSVAFFHINSFFDTLYVVAENLYTYDLMFDALLQPEFNPGFQKVVRKLIMKYYLDNESRRIANNKELLIMETKELLK